MKTVLGIDLGTQSLKVVFYDYETCAVVASQSKPLELVRRTDGTAEQDATWWTEAMSACLVKVPAGVRASVKAIAVSGQQHGLVALDGRGKVLAPVKLWCDTSTQAEAEAITAAAGGRDACIELTGNPVLTGYTSPKIRWLRDRRPDVYARLATVLLPHDYLNYVLTGECSMEYGDASGTGLLDVRERRWSSDMLAAVDDARDLAQCLPPLVAAGDMVGQTTQVCTDRFGLPAGVPVATGGGDNMMAAVGTGNVSPGRLTMSLGSSGTLYAFADKPVVDPLGEVAAFCSSTGGWLPLVCTMNCTLGTELMSQVVGANARELDDEITNVPAGADGLLTLPFFNGERTPNLPNGKGCLLGLSSHNCTRGHVLRATVEGATYALKFGLERLGELGVDATEVVLTGGGANSASWRQIVADVCNLPVTILRQDEGASFGAALQALWSLERSTAAKMSIDDVVAAHLSGDDSLSTEPVADNVARYAEGYAAYQSALRHVTPLYQ